MKQYWPRSGRGLRRDLNPGFRDPRECNTRAALELPRPGETKPDGPASRGEQRQRGAGPPSLHNK